MSFDTADFEHRGRPSLSLVADGMGAREQPRGATLDARDLLGRHMRRLSAELAGRLLGVNRELL